MSARAATAKKKAELQQQFRERLAEERRLKAEAARNMPWSTYLLRKSIPLITIVLMFVGFVGMCYISYLLSFIMPAHPSDIEYIVEESIKSMLSIESRLKVRKDLNVGVGFGSCLDIFVSSEKLFLEEFDPPKELMYRESIRNQEELNEVFAFFFVAGAAAERYIDNKTFFEELVDKARHIEGSRIAIGGNAAVMARRFIREGVDKVVLGTQHSKRAIEAYHEKLMISGPIVDDDDIHLILEYPAGAVWGEYVAPRANRLIIHSDMYNPKLKSVDNFLDRLASFKSTDLIVIGGLQMLDNIPVDIEERREKIEKLGRELAKLPPKQPRVHLELASFSEQALLKLITDLILPGIDSIGMNEQELPTLLNFMNYGEVDLRSEAYPRVSTTLDQMRQLFRLLHFVTKGRLSRIHAHTLAFQAILTRNESGWNNTLTSSVIAALTAHRYTCGSEKIDMEQAKLIMDDSYTTSQSGSRRQIPFNPKHPAVCWQESIYVAGLDTTDGSPAPALMIEVIEICVAPVLVCTKVQQTGGAGDNISAASLIYNL